MKTTGIVDFLLCTIALALGVTVMVLTVLNRIDPRVEILLLGGAVCCIGLSLLDTESPIKALKKNRSKKRR